jgi:class 3 adenylate cyclase
MASTERSYLHNAQGADVTADPRTAVHCTILVVDVEAFGDPQRTMQHQLNVRAGLYRALRAAFDAAGIPWQRCYHEDRGDGVLVLVPADLPKAPIVDALPGALATALQRHNSIHPDPEKIRLRMAVHAGEVTYDPHGVTARSINLTFRLLEASSLKTALAQSGGTLALIVSEWLFDEVVRHTPVADPSTWRQVTVAVKETTTSAWVSLPDHPYPPNLEALVPRTAEKSRPVPDQLPAPPRWFTGRTEELETLTAALTAAEDTTGHQATVIISAICGAGGTPLCQTGVRHRIS